MGPSEILEMTPAILPGAIVDNTAFTSQVIDVSARNAKCLAIVIVLGASDVAMAELKINQSDTKTDETTLDSAVELADFADSATLPSATDDGKMFGFLIDLRRGDLKRYVQLHAVAGDGAAGTYASALAFFYNPANPAENFGLDSLVEV